MFYQVFLLPQVRRCEIISYKHGVYELPHELPNELIRKLGISQKSGKSQNFIELILVLSLPAKMKILSELIKNS